MPGTSCVWEDFKDSTEDFLSQAQEPTTPTLNPLDPEAPYMLQLMLLSRY